MSFKVTHCWRHLTLAFLIALDLSPALPTTLGVVSKWAAESVRHIFLPSSTFIANVKGYPVLHKPTQAFIRDSIIASYPLQRFTDWLMFQLSAPPHYHSCWCERRTSQSWRRKCILSVSQTPRKNEPGGPGCSKSWDGGEFCPRLPRLPPSALASQFNCFSKTCCVLMSWLSR